MFQIINFQKIASKINAANFINKSYKLIHKIDDKL